ncbi:type II toxin-antitoxin system VapC family toxin [Mycobacterium tuberculosis]|uniref:type II toxin-antitoxin system VapC family toxin n=1 Tax=Mycobacterium tuberculosis TaxID=1773 RepID=UPI0004F3B814
MGRTPRDCTPAPHDSVRVGPPDAAGGERLVTDAEVLQEICHRYVAIKRREAIQPAFDAIIGVVDEVLPIERTDVEHARDALLRYQTLSARDALHIAVMAHHDITRLMSFDRGFDSYPGIKRLA